jgi:ketosteroid isomerase-like protein
MLDRPHPRFIDAPFFAETVTLLRSVREHDFDTLAALCDDDFGIVDVDPSGSARIARDRDEWEAWFCELFLTLESLGADTDSEILDYRAIAHDTLGFSVLEFRQSLSIGEHTATFDCITTIVWKRTPDGWREARWHGSVVSSVIPEGMLAA